MMLACYSTCVSACPPGFQLGVGNENSVCKRRFSRPHECKYSMISRAYFNTHTLTEKPKWYTHTHTHGVMWSKTLHVQKLDGTLMLWFCWSISQICIHKTKNSWWPIFCRSISPMTCHSRLMYQLCFRKSLSPWHVRLYQKKATYVDFYL